MWKKEGNYLTVHSSKGEGVWRDTLIVNERIRHLEQQSHPT